MSLTTAPTSPPSAAPKPAATTEQVAGHTIVADTPHVADPRSSDWLVLGHGVSIRRTAWTAKARQVLTPEAIALVGNLHRSLESERQELLVQRVARQLRFDDGALPTPPRHADADATNWSVAPLPQDLRRRRVEITGPVSNRSMVITMLSRTTPGTGGQGVRADTAMLDFEDSMKPVWDQVVDGVHNVVGACRGELRATKRKPDGSTKTYVLDPRDMALPMVRVRGLHLDESNVRVDETSVAGGLLDLALCFINSYEHLLRRGMTPTYYVPKCEHHLEARWWNRLFVELQKGLGVPIGTLRATFLIETLPAAFAIEPILFEIREHAAGLNVGRWDKIFSDIKVLMKHPGRVMADRATIGMNRPWMRAYAERLIDVCHRRGAMAIGGMAAFTPGRDAATRDRQTAKVLEDKRLEASLGHDGCWVSHPYFIATALGAFPNDHQLDFRAVDVPLPEALLPQGTAPRTEAGLRTNLRVAIAYLEGWSRGLGCVAWDNLMEDLATLEISRAQTWQWLHHRTALDDGTYVERDRVERLLDEELTSIEREVEAGAPTADAATQALRSFRQARDEAGRLFASQSFEPFLATASDAASEASSGDVSRL